MSAEVETPQSGRSIAGRSIRLDAMLIVIGDALRVASGMFSAILLARLLTLEQMGTYRQVLVVASMIYGIGELEVSSAIYRFWGILEGERQRTYGMMSLAALTGLGLLSSLALVISAPFLARAYDNPGLLEAMLLLSPLPFVSILTRLVRPILISEGKPMRTVYFELSYALGGIAAMAIPMWLGGSFQLALTCFSLVLLVFIPLTLLIIWPYISWRRPFWQRDIFSQVWIYLLPLQIGKIPLSLMGNLDKLVLPLFVDAEAFAIYSLGARSLPFVTTVSASISNVLVPRLVQDIEAQDYDMVSARWRSISEKTAMLMYPIGAFAVIYALPIVSFLFSTQYQRSAVVFQIYALFIFIRVIDYSSIAKATGKSRIILNASLVALVSFPFLAFILFMIWGSNGMALSMVLMLVVFVLYHLFVYRKLVNQPILRIFPVHRLLPIMLIAFVATIASQLLMEVLGFLPNYESMLALFVYLAVVGVLSMSLYAVLLLAIFPPARYTLLEILRQRGWFVRKQA